ncbi:MAG: SapC family protein [Rhodobacteraceae bacterium]|nr:SapC family protein [Paracoccaceae bacterium]
MTGLDAPKLVLLSRERHSGLRWRKPEDYGFARAQHHVPLVLAEIEVAAAALPVLFAEDPAGGLPRPVALLRLNADHSPYVTQDGRWLAPYIPALLRVHPFSARPAPQTGQTAPRMELLVDESTGLITEDATALRFFDPLGAPSKALEKVVHFFQHYGASTRATRIAMQALAEARSPDGTGLFRALTHRDQAMPGLLGLDRAAFDALDDSTFLKLRATGALPLAIAHFIARTQLDWLDRAERALSQGTQPNTAPTGTRTDPNDDVSGFLAALASAQETDNA